jgi:hypothetical protein
MLRPQYFIILEKPGFYIFSYVIEITVRLYKEINMSNETEKFHSLAKDAGNKLRAYILSVSSGATGIFFFTLSSKEVSTFTAIEKSLLVIGLIGFVLTIAISLFELRIDAQRFFDLAKEVDKEQDKKNWGKNKKYKDLRYKLIHGSYLTFGAGVISTSIYLILRVTV